MIVAYFIQHTYLLHPLSHIFNSCHNEKRARVGALQSCTYRVCVQAHSHDPRSCVVETRVRDDSHGQTPSKRLGMSGESISAGGHCARHTQLLYMYNIYIRALSHSYLVYIERCPHILDDGDGGSSRGCGEV